MSSPRCLVQARASPGAVSICFITFALLLVPSLDSCWRGRAMLSASSFTTYSVSVEIEVTTPLQSVPVTIQLERVEVSPPGNYNWGASSNLGTVSPSSDSGQLPIREVCFTYSPGSTPIDYRQVSIVLTVYYRQPYVSSATQQYTITFSPRYQVNVVSERGTTSGTGLYEAGSYARPSVTPSEAVESGSVKHQLNGWKVQTSGQPQYSIGPTGSARITQVTTLTATWETSYFATFTGPGNQTGGWFVKDSKLVFTSPQCVQDGQFKRRVLDGYNVSGTFVAGSSCSVTLSSPLSVTAVYHDEFCVRVISDRGVTSGSGWYAAGAKLLPSVAPTVVNDSSVSRWRFAGWNATVPLSVTGPVDVVASWTREYYVEVRTYSSGTVAAGWYASGTEIRVSGSQPRDFGNGTLSLFSGWSDENAEFDRTLSISGPLLLSERRSTYYEVVVSPSHPSVALTGDDYQGSWFRAGTAVRATAPAEVNETTGVKLVFEGFLRPVETSSTDVTFAAEGPIEVVAQWRRHFLITADGVHADVRGAGWYPEGAQVSLEVLKEQVEETESSRWLFDGWDREVPFLANDTVRVTARWRREYLVTVASPLGRASGGGWYGEGDTVHMRVEPTQLSLANGSQATFRCWRVNGSDISGSDVIARGALNCLAIWDLSVPPSAVPGPPQATPPPGPPTNHPPPTSPHNDDDDGGRNQDSVPPPGGNSSANSTSSHPTSAQQPRTFTLDVVTDHSSCAGAGTYPEGTVVTVKVQDEITVVSSCERCRFSGWFNESGALLSDLPMFDLTLTRNATVRALWVREFLVGESWLPENVSTALTARPPIPAGDMAIDRFQCWLLRNGSRLYAETISLPAQDAAQCSELRIVCYAVTFKLCGTSQAQVSVQTEDGSCVKTLNNGETLWVPRGAMIRLDDPMWLLGGPRSSLSSIVVEGATEVEVRDGMLHPVEGSSELWLPVDEGPFEPSGHLLILAMSSVAFVATIRSVRSLGAHFRNVTSRRRPNPVWKSLEEYVRRVSGARGRSGRPPT